MRFYVLLRYYSLKAINVFKGVILKKKMMENENTTIKEKEIKINLNQINFILKAIYNIKTLYDYENTTEKEFKECYGINPILKNRKVYKYDNTLNNKMEGLKMEVQQENTENKINKIYPEFTRDFLNCILTAGFRRWCEEYNSYWSFTDMAVIVMSKFLNKEDFIVMFVESKNKKAEIKLYSDYDERGREDKNFNKNHLLYTQKYEWTDLKEGKYKFYVCYNEIGTFTFMLPEEY